MKRYYGKYRGKVEGNIDPLNQGRLRVSVASVFGKGNMNWAMPCVPFAGAGLGFLFLPPTGANVWVEFEEGNSQKPIWTGCFWGAEEALPLQPLPIHKVLKTAAFELSIMEPPENSPPSAAIVEIKTASGFSIKIDPLEVTIGNGIASIVLRGPTVVINKDGLEVT